MPRFSNTLLLLAIASWFLCALISFVPFPILHTVLLNPLSYVNPAGFANPSSYANPSRHAQSIRHLSHLSHQNAVAMLCFLFAIACSFVAGGVWGMEYQTERLDRSRYAQAMQDVEYAKASLEREGVYECESGSDDGSVTEKCYGPYRYDDDDPAAEVGEQPDAEEFWRNGHKEGWAAYHWEVYGECEEGDEVVGDAMVSETRVDETSVGEVEEDKNLCYATVNPDPMTGHMHACLPEWENQKMWETGMQHIGACWAWNEDHTAILPPTPNPPMVNRYTDAEIAKFGAATPGLGFAPREVYDNYSYTHKAAVDMRSGARLYTVFTPRSSTPVPDVHPNPFPTPYSDTPVGRTSEEREPRSAFEFAGPYTGPTQQEIEEREANDRQVAEERQKGLVKGYYEWIAEIVGMGKITCEKDCCTEGRVLPKEALDEEVVAQTWREEEDEW